MQSAQNIDWQLEHSDGFNTTMAQIGHTKKSALSLIFLSSSTKLAISRFFDRISGFWYGSGVYERPPSLPLYGPLLTTAAGYSIIY